MQSYKDKSNREADFLISYEWLEQKQKLFQHIRSDFLYETDSDSVWCIWPEFVDEKMTILNDIPNKGRATMWILNSSEENMKFNNAKLNIGTKGFLMAGANKIAKVKVIEIYNQKLIA